MKKKILGWGVFAGGLLVVGLAMFGSKTPRGANAAPERSVDVARKPAPANAAAVAVAAEPAVVAPGTDASVASVASAADGLRAERQTMLGNGDVESRRMIAVAGKYPNRVVVETLRRDRRQRKFVPVGRTEMVADHVLVNLRPGADRAAFEQLVSEFDAQIERSLSDGRTFIVQLQAPSLDAVDEAIGYFSEAAAAVAYAEPDYVRHISGTVPNDLMYGDLWAMPQISAPDAWSITTGSDDIVVAVIDTGMDMDHADLLSNLWANDGEIAGDDIDNDGNGYVDDVNGWDFVSTTNGVPEDGHGHGTHCAGTIGAVGNNANQVVGLCWDVSIMPIRCASDDGSMLDADIVEGIYYAADNGAKVISNSYGGEGFSQTTYEAVSHANDLGAIFVAAAGNDSNDNDDTPQYPAGYDLPNVISVAATDSDDNLASFSNYGETSVDLAAPGVDIVSTYLNGETTTMDGTSMACPHVAGALALLVSTDSDMTPSEAKQLLLSSVDDVSALTGKVVSGGRLNVHAMFANANDTDKDGIPDSWEDRYGFDSLNAADAVLDGDNDFLTNLEEYQNGSDPTKSDSDGDSLIDGWEVLYGFNPVNVHGALPRLQYLGFNGGCLDAQDIVVKGGYAYVADGAYGFKVLSLTDPANPVLVGSYSTSGDAHGVDVEGDYAYVADYENGLYIFDISDPSDPVLKASLATTALNVDVVGDYAYVAAYDAGFKIASVADRSKPTWKGAYWVAGLEVYDVTVSGTKAYLGVNGAVATFDVTDPAKPQFRKQHVNGNDGLGVFFDSGTLYAAVNPFGVVAYNSMLTGIDEYETGGTVEDVCFGEGLVFVADGANGLVVLDATDPTDIVSFTEYANIDAYGVTLADGYAYVAGGGDGIQIFQSSVDTDEDGMYDAWEIEHFGSLAEGAFADYDGDGIFNWGEYLADLDPTKADQDGDGLVDGTDEVQTYLTDPRTVDTDDDGLTDSEEVNTHGTDPLLADSDSDGMTDGWEVEYGLDPLVDDGAEDPDADGATNAEEEAAGTNPSLADTDADGMPDGWEIETGLDPLLDDAAGDPDSDGFANLIEYQLVTNGLYLVSTNPNLADTDADGLTDPQEVNETFTNPTVADTDGDGMPDGWETKHGLDPLDDGSTDVDNGPDGDQDNDGLLNYYEYLNGSDPDNDDTDDDGFDDPTEFALGTMATNRYDPVVVDDDAEFDVPVWNPDLLSWEGGMPQDPQQSDPDEDGSISHPFDAIQEAINVASNGFTVLVKPGKYYGTGNRNINPGSKQLRILAEDQSDPSLTLVKSHGLSPVFVFEGGQSTATVLAGFSIQSSMQGIDCSNGDCGEMNGIICQDASSPLITNCVVEICRDTAVYCDFNSSPVLSNVTIRTIYEGHGIHAIDGSTPSVMGCTISGIYAGCGIYADESAGLEVIDSTISNCGNSFGVGRGIWLVDDEFARIANTVVSGCQGGIRCDGSSPEIDRCTISGNTAPDYFTAADAYGYAWTNIAVLANDTDDMADEINDEENGGGILLMAGSFPLIQNCVIAGNGTVASDPDYSNGDVAKPYYGLGGGIFSGADCAVELINCTVVSNTAMTLGGGFTTYGNHEEYLRNDVLWGNACHAAWLDTEVEPAVLLQPGNAYYNALHCNEGSSHFDPWYCNIEDGWGFVGDRYNIEADPLFMGGGDYHLTEGSPCIDAGTFYNAPLYDRDNLPRPLDGDTDTNNFYSVDIGAYEFLNGLADTDRDGILDAVEISSYNTDPTLADSDADGLLDGYEVENGLSNGGNDADGDADGDGLSNLEEQALGTSANNADTDGDLSSDSDELIAGTDPQDGTKYLQVAGIRQVDVAEVAGCEIPFQSVAGRTYTLERCTNLLDWAVLIDGIEGAGSEITVRDAENNAGCFYRLKVELVSPASTVSLFSASDASEADSGVASWAFRVSDVCVVVDGGVEGCDVTFDTLAGRFYTVQWSPAENGPWEIVQADIEGTGAAISVRDLDNGTDGLYRVEVKATRQ
ncbi:S8 family serine peptidase [Pontiella sp.]|uniref:S8 family serine peptidase n=1 Tax=Pontiella sp. TaxID=2837462 RepID=UPI003567A10A